MPSPATTAGLVPTRACATACSLLHRDDDRPGKVAVRPSRRGSTGRLRAPSRWTPVHPDGRRSSPGPMPGAARGPRSAGAIFVPSTRMFAQPEQRRVRGGRERREQHDRQRDERDGLRPPGRAITRHRRRTSQRGAPRARARRRPSAGPAPGPDRMSARTSPARGTGTRHDEVGVLRRHRGAADARPLEPGVLDQPRARMPSGRVLEHAPAVGLGERLGSPAPCPGLVHRGADRIAGSPAASASVAPTTIGIRREGRPPVARTRPPRRRPSPRAHRQSRKISTRSTTSPISPVVRARVHLDGAPQAGRDRDAELEPAEPVAERDARERRAVAWRRPRGDPVAVAGRPPVPRPEPEHEARRTPRRRRGRSIPCR